MKVEKITVQFLKKVGACRTGIHFFKRNGLEGFPVSLISQIKGDHDGFVKWIEEIIDGECKYDKNGNIIYRMDDEGNEYRWEYEYDLNEIRYMRKIVLV